MANSALDFERTARRDFRMWLAAFVGSLMAVAAINMLTQSGPMAIEDAPLWMSLIFLFAGLGMGGIAALGLIANTSRGCHVDSTDGTLTWWQMRFARQSLVAKDTIALTEISRIVVDNSGDGLSIALFDIQGDRRDGFGELTLPSDHDAWLRLLIEQYPHIEIERR